MQKIEFTDLSAAEKELVEAAILARTKAYAPMSRFLCGAALRDITGAIHWGCNIETIDMTLTTHAESDAINGMLKSGVFQLQTLVCVVKSPAGFALPCGLCRQKIREFSANNEARIIGVNLDEHEQIRHVVAATIGELYPHAFTPASL